MTQAITSCANIAFLVTFGTGAPTTAAQFNGKPVYVDTATGIPYFLNGTTVVQGGSATTTTPPTGESANCTTITPGTGTIVLAGHNWTVTAAGVMQVDGANADFTANVVEAKVVDLAMYHLASNGAVFKWNGTGWDFFGAAYPACVPGGGVQPPTPSSLIDIVIADAKSMSQIQAKGGNENAIAKNILQTGSNSNTSQSGAPGQYGAREYVCPNGNSNAGAYWGDNLLNNPNFNYNMPTFVAFGECIPTATTPDNGVSPVIQSDELHVLVRKAGVWSEVASGFLDVGTLFLRAATGDQYSGQPGPAQTTNSHGDREVTLPSGRNNLHNFMGVTPAGGTAGYETMIIYKWERFKPGTSIPGVAYGSHVGGDWYKGGTGNGGVVKCCGCDYGAGMGQGMPKNLTETWQLMSWIAVKGLEPGGDDSPTAGGVSEANFRANPPPIVAAPAY